MDFVNFSGHRAEKPKRSSHSSSIDGRTQRRSQSSLRRSSQTRRKRRHQPVRRASVFLNKHLKQRDKWNTHGIRCIMDRLNCLIDGDSKCCTDHGSLKNSTLIWSV